MKHKRLTAIVMSLVLMMSSSLMIFAGNDNTIDDVILEQAIAIDDKMTLSDGSYFVVECNEVGLGSRAIGAGSKAIQKVETENDEKRITTVVPYKITENNELVNSFEYASNQNARSSTVPITYVDITVTITASFDYLTRYTGSTYYRHNGVEFYWSSNLSNVSIDEIDVLFGSNGDVYRYPDCYDNHSGAYISGDYYISSQLYVDWPAENQIYDQYDPMPYENVLYCSKYYEHGGAVTFWMSYTINGSSGTYQDPGYTVFSK